MNKTVVLLALTGLAVAPQASAEPVGEVLAFSHAIHAVEDLDTTLAFYREVFGVEGNPIDFDNPGVPLLQDAPGVTLRMSMVRLPGGTRFEFTHFMGLERQPGRAAWTDPGAGTLVLHVRDIDALTRAAQDAGAEIVTTGGTPMEISTGNGRARSIVLRDPDGFFVQLIEDTPMSGAPDGNVHRVSLAYTIEDVGATRDFYTGMMGIELDGSATFERDAELARLIGAPEDVEFRQVAGQFPPGVEVVFTEFRGVPQTRFDIRVRDPGAPALAVQVRNIEGMIAQMKGAGVNVISTDGELVDFGNGVYTIFVEDPSGLNIEIFERPAGR